MYARGAQHPLREPCRRALRAIADGKLSAVTSVEVLQELLHRYISIRRLEEARLAVHHFMAIVPKILPVTQSDIEKAAGFLMEFPQLPARDLVHLAVMANNAIDTILSVDSHFDQVQWIRRIDPSHLEMFNGT